MIQSNKRGGKGFIWHYPGFLVWFNGQYIDDVLIFLSYVDFRGKILLFQRINIVFFVEF